MLEVQVQFAVTFERIKVALWDFNLASAPLRSIKWIELQKSVFLVDLNGSPWRGLA
jgi:hypothetical protein